MGGGATSVALSFIQTKSYKALTFFAYSHQDDGNTYSNLN
jgi:hypothetical protein